MQKTATPLHLNQKVDCIGIFENIRWHHGHLNQELSYRQQIVLKLHTQYAEGIYRHTIVTLKCGLLEVIQGH